MSPASMEFIHRCNSVLPRALMSALERSARKSISDTIGLILVMSSDWLTRGVGIRVFHVTGWAGVSGSVDRVLFVASGLSVRPLFLGLQLFVVFALALGSPKYSLWCTS